ncbi:Rhs family protein [Yersinia mollaretii ATCC 43969]|uniref:Rhs family protein n=1 Tax=Yersinia mollaretii (strain ATCC 43969 / DSM 18520 / CIP 103324 / CNY 7263 / WAIP 204) TaxID=349967 RepID=A0ABM9Y5T3_YERMW|nr:hypothetical protein [Yersinia mollaretii]EEQ09140.1 Rhs family protein [Yersinia mollaretii ATCC 43969]QKJ02310.1 hypothetical protein HRD69_04490 [Yersinia mollaretii ATCC 43969]
MNNKNSYDQHTVNDNDVNVNDPLLKKHQGVNGDMLLDKLDDNGKVIWRERMVHNKKGELTSTVITTFGRTETGRIINRHDATYNTSGELVKCNELIRTGRGKSAMTNKSEYEYQDGRFYSKFETTLNFRHKIVNKVEQLFSSHGDVVLSTKSIYDDNRLTEREELRNIFDSNRKLTLSTKERHDDLGQLIIRSEKSNFRYGNGNRWIAFEERSYNSNNELIDIADISQYLDDNGDVSELTEEVYDSEEELRNEKPIKTVDKSFDSAGNVIFNHESSADGREMTTVRQKFDSSGKLQSKVEENRRFHDGLMYEDNMSIYGANGALIRAVEISLDFDYSHRVLKNRTESTYDVDINGNIIDFVEISQKFNAEGELTSCASHKYDASGNLIESLTGPHDHNYVTSDQLVSAMGGFNIESCIPTLVSKMIIPNMASDTLVTPL